jgi:diadenosine tetraphosphatase ApaH/serine/threonine PP2A family protein phosphatase
MTYALISDIHGNLEAFDAVLAALPDVDGFLCLGDIVGYGPDPGGCVDRLRELPNLTCVAGNHDLAAIGRYDINWFNRYAGQAILWTAEQLTAEQKAHLSSLPLAADVPEAVLVHGSLAEPMAYITSVQEAMDCFDEMPDGLCFVGHTHIAEYYRRRNAARSCDQVSLWSGGVLSLEADLSYIVNPGAIGQPRDGNPTASFGLYDPDGGRIETRRVEYPVERVQDRMRDAGLPQYLVERLARGR